MDDIKLNDWQRILIGEAPVEFLLEVLLRTIIIYLFLLVILRLMGKRMTGQLTISEMAVMITLGAIVSAPMQIPDRGILQGIVILVCALTFQRGLNFLGFKSSKAEAIIQGKESILVEDGILKTEEMRKAKISKQQLYAALRNARIYNLGEVERAYLESCGLISIFTFNETKRGLPIFPVSDEGIKKQNDYTEHFFVCENCGKTENDEKATANACPNCHHKNWKII